MAPSPEQTATHDIRPGAASVAAIAALLAAAVSITAVAFTDDRFRNAEGYISGNLIFPASFAIAAILIASGIYFRLAASAALLGLALIAQSASLQLVEAGPAVGYQHYRPLSRMLDGYGAVFVTVLLIQAVTVAGGLFIRARRVRSPARPAWSAPWRIALVLIALSALSATFSRRPDAYAAELVLASMIQLAALGNVLLFALSLPADAVNGVRSACATLLVPRKASPGSPGSGRPEIFPLATAVAVFIATSLLGLVAYEWHPHIPDEVSYMMQAGYFAEGKLYRVAPPVAGGFDVDLMHIAGGKWYSPFPPGWPLVLALGIVAGFPWLVNPLLSAAAVVLGYRFLRDNLSIAAARVTILLLAVSPWFLFMGMSVMSHTLALVLALCAAVAVTRYLRGRGLTWMLLAGMATGYLSLARPLDGLVVACMIGVSLLAARSAIRRFRALALFAVSCGTVSAMVLPYNKVLTGNPRIFPLTEYFDSHYTPGANDMGFGADRGLGWTGLDPFHGHGVVDVVINAGMNAFAMNIELLGWATGSVVLVLAFVVSRRMRRFDAFMLGVIAAVAGFYSLYWFSGGPDFGARYWFLMLLPCLILTARAIEALAESRGTTLSGEGDAIVPRALAGVAALSVMAVVTFIPWRAADKYHHYRGMRPGVEKLASQHAPGGSLVLVHGARHPDYASAAVYNEEISDSGAPIFAWARSPEVVDSLRAAFPDRITLNVNGPSLTGRGFRLVDWPEPKGGKPAVIVTVDTLVRYQTMTGWEATAQAGQEDAGFSSWKEELAASAVNDLGINRIRLEVTSGSENRVDYYRRRLSGKAVNARCERYVTVNDNPDPLSIDSAGFHFSWMDSAVVNVVLPIRDALRARGERLFLNLNYVAFIKQCAGTAFRYVHSDPAEYAEFVLAAFLHLERRFDLIPDAVEVILEPDNVSAWDGQLIGRAIVASAARLSEHGFRPAFIAPSASRASNAPRLAREMLAVPGAAEHITEISYHRYGAVSRTALRTIAALANENGLKTSMLERIGSDVDALHQDLTVANASAWQQYTLAFPTEDNGAQYYTIRDKRPVMGKRTRYLSQYFRHVRAGAQRVGAAGATDSIRCAAFLHPDGRIAVIVHAERAGAVEIRGLPEGRYGASVTTEVLTGFELPPQTVSGAEPLTVVTPAKGVLTIYSRS